MIWSLPSYKNKRIGINSKSAPRPTTVPVLYSNKLLTNAIINWSIKKNWCVIVNATLVYYYSILLPLTKLNTSTAKRRSPIAFFFFLSNCQDCYQKLTRLAISIVSFDLSPADPSQHLPRIESKDFNRPNL